MEAQRLHELKCQNGYFEMIEKGLKRFELRNNDRDFREGDTVLLKEVEGTNATLTGRAMLLKVGFVLRGYSGLQDGYCIWDFKVVSGTFKI